MATAEPPSLWLLLGDKLGDNAQAEIIADSLGWPYARKSLKFKARYATNKPWFRATLNHVDPERSNALAPPWPEFVLTVGRRPAMAALWVREQSGGRTRIVLIGRPRRGLERYALVIVPPQYRVPAAPNILHLGLPLMRIDEAAIAEARERWRAEMADLPRPLTAVLVGGPTRPFRFDAGVARDLLRETVKATGDAGSLYVTTSRRTPEAVAEALAAALPAALPGRARLFRWAPEAADNPYLGLLAHADRFVATGDSISMMVEVARLGRPLAIFPLPVAHPRLFRLWRAVAESLLPRDGGGPGREQGLRHALGARLFRLGVLGYPRDFTDLHETLIGDGLAARLGDPFPPGGRAPDAIAQVVARIKALARPEN